MVLLGALKGAVTYADTEISRDSVAVKIYGCFVGCPIESPSSFIVLL